MWLRPIAFCEAAWTHLLPSKIVCGCCCLSAGWTKCDPPSFVDWFKSDAWWSPALYIDGRSSWSRGAPRRWSWWCRWAVWAEDHHLHIGEQRVPEMVSHRASCHGRRIHSTFEMGQGSGKARSRKRAQHWQRKQGGPKQEMVRRSYQASHLEQEFDGVLLFWEICIQVICLCHFAGSWPS